MASWLPSATLSAPPVNARLLISMEIYPPRTAVPARGGQVKLAWLGGAALRGVSGHCDLGGVTVRRTFDRVATFGSHRLRRIVRCDMDQRSALLRLHVGRLVVGQIVHDNHCIVGTAVRFSRDRKSTRLNSSHPSISYAVFCLKKKNKN